MNKQLRHSGLKQALALAFANHRLDVRAVSVPQILSSMLGLSLPVAVGVLTGYQQAGIAASLGGLAIGVQPRQGFSRGRLSGVIYTIAAGGAAMFWGTAWAGRGATTGIAVLAVSFLVALLGGISRPLARAATQFIIFLIIAANMPAAGLSAAGMTVLFMLGASGTACLLFMLEVVFRARGADPGQALPAPRRYSAGQLLRHWRKSLAGFAGWQYTLRIMLCLGIAEVIRWLWPHPHSYWISLTVAIVVHRDLQSALTRTFQRMIGTAFGVMLTSILLLGLPPFWVLIVLVAVLAAARPVLIHINYIAYAAGMTPLIILLLDFGKPTPAAVVADRLLATLIGCLIAFLLGYAVWPRSAGSMKTAGTGQK